MGITIQDIEKGFNTKQEVSCELTTVDENSLTIINPMGRVLLVVNFTDRLVVS